MTTSIAGHAAALALPRAARAYIAVIAGLGAALLVLSGFAALQELPAPHGATMVVLAGLGAGTIVNPLRFHRGGRVHGFHLTFAVHIALMLLTADAVAVLVTSATALLGYGLSTRSVVKTSFNVGQEVLWAVAATAAARAVLGGDVAADVLSARGALAVLAAGCVAVLVNTALTTELFHHLDGTSRRSLLADVSGLVTIVALSGSLVVALLLVILGERSAVGVLLAVPLLAGLVLGYRGSAAEREAARKARAMQRTSSQLLEAALEDDALRAAVGGLRELFGAERAVLDAGEGTGDPQLRSVLDRVRRDGAPVLDTAGDGLMVAPVVLDGRIVAALAVTGRRGLAAWRDQDLALLSTVAGEIGATLRARELLGQLERERASLQIETQRLGDILRSASDGIVLLDANGLIQAWNPAMAVLAGCAQEMADGRAWDDVLRLEDEEGTALSSAGQDPFSVALSTGQTLERATLRLQHRDGGHRWLRCSAAPVRRNGALEGVVLVAVDLTREREVEELRGDFLATVSHELRTPLTPLRGFLSVLREHGDRLEEDRVEVIHTSMDNQLRRLEDLIGDLLLVAEVERSTPTVRVEPIDVAEVVRTTLDGSTLDPIARARIALELDPRVGPATADPAALRRALGSVLTNAIKHTDGLVDVTLSTIPGWVVLAVSDRGPGIAEASREVIFEPFRRLGDHLHRTQGPGLGLSIARALMEAQGGLLEVAAHDAGGSTFTLTVPAAEGPVQAGDAERSRERGRTGGRR